jgi:hypothetical protein
MEDLLIPGTDSLPTVSFKTSGELKIEGRALPEDASKLFAPLIAWIVDCTAEEMNIEMNLDYFNTSVSKQLLDLFKKIEKNPNCKTVNLKWMYEEGDDEMLETGELYQELLPGFIFTFHRYTEIVR